MSSPEAAPTAEKSVEPVVQPASDNYGAGGTGAASSTTFIGSQPIGRSLTGGTQRSRMSRITSKLPNPERSVAEGPQPGGGPPPGRPPLAKYAYGFFSPEMKMFRGIVMKILGMTVALTIIIMWTCATFYWGSLWKSNHYTDRLTVRVIDLDGGPIGQAISSALLARHELGYFYTAADHFPDMAAIERDVVQEGAWGTITINAGASAALEAARAAGDPTYNGSSAVSFFVAQARNELATGTYLMTLGQAALSQITVQLSVQSVAQFLSANGGNATAMAAVARAPATISNPISYTLVNLRPYNQPVAAAITLVGLIYVLIFAFNITMANNACREIIAPYLTTRSYLLYRILMPLFLYVPLSFSFAMVNLPFKAHFDARFTYAGGFFLWWVILYLCMAASGLATEFAITILGPKFMGFFLVPLIVANVSGVSVPHELQPWIYRYNLGMPFYNTSRAVRTIIFDTKDTIGLNVGVLFAWIGVSLVTITLATWLFRRGAVNEHYKAIGQDDFDRKLPDGTVV